MLANTDPLPSECGFGPLNLTPRLLFHLNLPPTFPAPRSACVNNLQGHASPADSSGPFVPLLLMKMKHERISIHCRHKQTAIGPISCRYPHLLKCIHRIRQAEVFPLNCANTTGFTPIKPCPETLKFSVRL